MTGKLFLLTFFASIAIIQITGLACHDRSNNEVAWFTFIKYPGKLTADSKRYAYLDVNLGDSYQIIYGSSLDEKSEAVPNTFAAINAISKKSLNLLAFNDEPPNSEAKSDGAHAKGVIAFDNSTKTGVYLMHSVPLFPTVETDGHIDETLPESSTDYGQNGYCISIDEDILNYLLASVPIEEPHVYYASGLFESLASRVKTSTSAIEQFNLLNGEEQWFITKSPKYAGFLYDDLIGPYFDTNLAVESWGRPYQDDSCSSKYSTLNIDSLAFNTADTWKHTQDHSKWAVTVDDSVSMACLCDMNRMVSQEKRGGSCLCTKNKSIYTALSAIVTLTDVCPSEDGFLPNSLRDLLSM